MVKGVEALKDLEILIDDRPAPAASQVRSVARKTQKLLSSTPHPLGFVLIDYLQLLTAQAPNRHQEVAAISHSLKALARELNVPVVVVSQLSREVESRLNKRPILSDLRDAGEIEQDADAILFLYRDGYYTPIETSPVGEEAEIILSKNRNGPTGTIKVMWQAGEQAFSPLETLHKSG